MSYRAACIRSHVCKLLADGPSRTEQRYVNSREAASPNALQQLAVGILNATMSTSLQHDRSRQAKL